MSCSYENTLEFFRGELGAEGCIDEETRERVYQCLAKHAVETLGNGTDMYDIMISLAYGIGFPFTLKCYDFGSAQFDNDYVSTAEIVRGLLDSLRMDGFGKNYVSVAQDSNGTLTYSWIVSDHYSFYVNDGKPNFFVNGKRIDIKTRARSIEDLFDSCIAPTEVIELWKRECAKN